jgi:hypothetical protein
VIKVDLPNVITIALSGALGYGVLIGAVKVWQMVKGQNAAAS